MKKALSFWLVCVGLLGTVSTVFAQQTEPALALVIVYDGSGSMKDKVPAENGKQAPKYVIANNAMVAIADKLQEYCDSHKTNIDAGLVMFKDSQVRTAIPMETFKADRFKAWARDFKGPNGGTPLGNGIQMANSLLSKSHAAKKHILVVTDGESNVGPSPESILSQMKASNAGVSVYFVAFDVEARVFEPVKTQGATVVSASDEARLRVQLDTIVGKKILLEAE